LKSTSKWAKILNVHKESFQLASIKAILIQILHYGLNNALWIHNASFTIIIEFHSNIHITSLFKN